MFILKRTKDLNTFFQNIYNISPQFLDNILKYIDINKIDYIPKCKLSLNNNDKILILYRLKPLVFPKILKKKYYYIIIGNNNNFNITKMLIHNKRNNIKGIFMDVKPENINYEKFNKKILNIKKCFDLKPPDKCVLLLNCYNLDINKININIPIFIISNNNINLLKYNKVILKIDSWKFNHFKKFDNKLCYSLEKLMKKYKNNKNFLLIDNKNLKKTKKSKLFFIK